MCLVNEMLSGERLPSSCGYREHTVPVGDVIYWLQSGHITIQDFPVKVAYGYLFNRRKITSKNIYDLCASYRKQF